MVWSGRIQLEGFVNATVDPMQNDVEIKRKLRLGTSAALSGSGISELAQSILSGEYGYRFFLQMYWYNREACEGAWQ